MRCSRQGQCSLFQLEVWTLAHWYGPLGGRFNLGRAKAESAPAKRQMSDLRRVQGSHSKEKQQDPISKARVANYVGAAESQAAARSPGPSSAANFAFTVPVKKRRPPTVDTEDFMSFDLQREERIKLDK